MSDNEEVEVVYDASDTPSENSASDKKAKKPKKSKGTKKATQPPVDPAQQKSKALPPPSPPPSAKQGPPTPLPKPKKKMTSFSGSIPAFNGAVDDFDVWLVAFKSTCKMNGLDLSTDKDKCQAIFLAHIGISNCALLADLVDPKKLENADLDELVSALQKYYKPQPKALAERFKFYTSKQNVNENATQWLTTLRKLAKNCKFGAELDNRLRDQFFIGLHNSKAQRAMFEKDDKITLDEALQLVVSMELTDKSTEIMRGGQSENSSGISFHKTGKFSKNNRSQGQQQKPQHQKNQQKTGNNHNDKQASSSKNYFTDQNKSDKCTRCGSARHSSRECKHKNVECFKCKKIGHFASVCFSKNNSSQVTNRITNINSVKCSSKGKPIYVTVKVNGIEHDMELDTGCQRSLLSFDFWENQL